jgi:hypothetical protein
VVWLRVAQTVHEFLRQGFDRLNPAAQDRFHEYTNEKAPIRVFGIRKWFSTKPQIPLEPEKSASIRDIVPAG